MYTAVLTTSQSRSVLRRNNTAAPTGPVAPAKPVALKSADVCAKGWKLSGKLNAKTGAFTCAAKAGTALPAEKPVCKGDLSYFENVKKGQYGCKP